MKKPNLFIVGAPKCGTTSMHYYLSQHPQIFMSTPKEIHHFCTDLIRESDNYHKSKKYFPWRDSKKYLSLFKNAKKEKIVGESSVFYLYSKEAAKNIYKFNPNSKIIIMIREPVEATYSYYIQLRRNPVIRETVKSFEKALELEPERKKWKKLPKKVEFPSMFLYRDMFKYYEQIKRYTKVFPREQIKIIIYDEFKKNTKSVYKDVLNFLGVKNITADFKILNKKMLPRVNMLERIASKTKIAYILKKIVNNKQYERIKKIFYKEAPPLNPETKIKLKKEFKREVEKLSDLIGKDLIKLWGYEEI